MCDMSRISRDETVTEAQVIFYLFTLSPFGSGLSYLKANLI